MKTFFNSTLLAAALLALGTPAAFAQHDAHASHGAANTSDSASAVMTKGVVTRWDPRGGKITIRHEEIANLEMPGMTMVFPLKQPEEAAAVKVGDTVRFHVEREGGGLVITKLVVGE